MVRDLGLQDAAPGCALIDPCVGPATFPISIERNVSPRLEIDAVDIDPRMCAITTDFSKRSRHHIQVSNGNYLVCNTRKQYDFAILNPPYVRQEWIRQKRSYRSIVGSDEVTDIPGTSNLYVYFIVKVLSDLRVEVGWPVLYMIHGSPPYTAAGCKRI